MKKMIAILLALTWFLFLPGCGPVRLLPGGGPDLELDTTQKIADVYHENADLFQNAIDAIRELVPSAAMIIDPISYESIHYYPEYEIEDLRFINVSDVEDFETICTALYDSIAPLFKEFDLWRISVSKWDVRIAFEFSHLGYASELFYVYDGSKDSFTSTMSIIEELQIDDHWYAVVNYDPEGAP